MRSFGSIALRQVRARRMRAVLTAAGIVLGVGMIFGVLTLATTISSTFSDLFDSIYGRTDLVVSGTDETTLPGSTLREVRETPGVEEASGSVFAVFTRIERRPEPEPSPPAEPPPSVPAPAEPPPQAEPPPPDPSQQLNVSGIDPAAENLTDARIVAGREVSSGLELTLQESWAEANEVEVGDRLRLATPAGQQRFRIVGLFEFSTGLDFGGQGFAAMPLERARSVMDKPRGFDEVNAVVAGDSTISDVRARLEDRFERGVRVETPQAKGEDVESRLQAFNAVLYFFAAMALFVGGFLIFNSFNMTVLQRIREIGMLRTLGATRGMVTGAVLREAAALGAIGAVLGCGLGLALAVGLARLMRDGLGFPIGDLVLTPVAPIAAVVVGLGTAVLGALHPARRAGRISPIRAVLGSEGLRRPPRARRAILGMVLIALGLGGAFWLGAADETTTLVVVAGMAGTVAIFFGIALVAPLVISPLVRGLSWPLRIASPVAGRLAADSARSDPGRTAATATGLMIGLALVVAVNSLGASFLRSIEDEFDRSFARDFTVQPRGFAPGEGPQQRIAQGLRDRIERIPQAGVVARERMLFTPELPGGDDSNGLLLAFEPQQYRHVDQTEVEGASRDQVFRRLDRGEVTVGKGHAEEAGLAVGDRVRLEGPSGTERTRVAGIVETVVFGGQTVGMSLETMRSVYGVTADSQLAITAASPDDRAELRRRIERILRRDHPNLAVLSNEDLKAEISSRIDQQFGIFYAIVGVAIFASLFGIVNTLSMSVLERTREIGVLRALGSTRWQVRRMVTHESLVIGSIGALLGIVVGAGLGWALLKGLSAGIPGVEYRPPLATMVWVGGAGLVLGLIAALLPARRAARLDVIRALSYE